MFSSLRLVAARTARLVSRTGALRTWTKFGISAGIAAATFTMTRNFSAFATYADSDTLNSQQIATYLSTHESKLNATPAERAANVVSSVFSNSVAANAPSEDRWSTRVVDLNTSTQQKLYLFGIFDGHAGAGAADFCKDSLLDFVCHFAWRATAERAEARKLFDQLDEKTQSQYREVIRNHLAQPYNVADVLKAAFEAADHTFLYTRLQQQTQEAIMDAISGACVIVVCVDGQRLYIANAGDCRAVLCSMDAAQNRTITQLSVDMHGETPSEVDRIRQEHPNEPDAIYRGRVKGMLQPTRGVGDGLYKVSQLNQLLQTPLPNWNPPYTTARPEVTTHDLTASDKFMVIATDGLWDEFTNEEVCDLVLQHQQLVQQGHADVPNVSTFLLRTLLTRVGSRLEKVYPNVTESDDNKISAAIQLPAQVRRTLYDDTTVTVVFFDAPKDGSTLDSNRMETFAQKEVAVPAELAALYHLQNTRAKL